MKKGFTLLELIIVIIIIGILATLGFVQYSSVIEKSRGAEARAVISTLRTQAVAKSMNITTATTIDPTTDLGLGTATGQISTSCAAANYFSYSASGCTGAGCTFTATRCTASGKAPQGGAANTLILTWTSAGTDTWSGTGSY